MSASGRAALGTAAFLSGLAALTHQILWIRWIGELCGATAVAIAVVLGVFFAGLGIGAAGLGRLGDRLRPARWFALLEVAIAAHALALALGFDALVRIVDAYVRADPSRSGSWSLAAAAGAVLLLPPSIAMGATLPALVKLAARGDGTAARGIGRIYAANTLGAAAGALLAVHAFVPALGLVGAAAAGACANTAAALIALVLGRDARATGPGQRAAAHEVEPGSPMSRRTVLLLALASGFVTIGLEVAWTRALSGRSQGTVYSFAAISAVFLVCLALPALGLERAARRGRVTAGTIAVALAAGGTLAVVTLHALVRIAPAGAGGGLPWPAELGAAALVTAPAALALAVVFPMTMRLAVRGEGRAASDVGAALAANTFGAVVAAPLVTFGALPWLGQRGTIGALALCACAAATFAAGRALRLRVAISAAVALAIAWTTAPSDVRPWRTSPGDRLVAYREGALASIAVVREADGDLALKLGAEYRLGSERTAFAQRRQGLLPVAARPDAAAPMLFLGLGTGGSAGAAVAAGVKPIEVAEIVPELIWAAGEFRAANDGIAAAATLHPGRVRILPVDARAYVRARPIAFATVVGDLFVPWRANEGSMYAREHLAAVRASLAAGGRFYQWLPLYQLSTADLRVIVATFLDVFPHVECAWLYWNAEQAAIALIASEVPWSIDERGPAPDPARAAVLAESGLATRADAAALWIADRAALARFAAGADVETRARPIVEFQAPLRRLATPAATSIANVTALDALYGELPAERLLPGTDDAERATARARHDAGRAFFAARAAQFAGRTRDALEHLAVAARSAPDWAWIAWNVDQFVLAAWDARDTSLVARGAEILRATDAGRAAGCWHAGRLRLAAGDSAGAAALAREGLAHEPTHAGCRELLERAERGH